MSDIHDWDDPICAALEATTEDADGRTKAELATASVRLRNRLAHGERSAAA
jgi:hypothetical protein